MTKFLDEWNLWLFGVFLLVVTGVSAWINGWTDDSRTGLIVATIWLAAAEVKDSLNRQVNKKVSVNSLSDGSIQRLKAAQETDEKFTEK